MKLTSRHPFWRGRWWQRRVRVMDRNWRRHPAARRPPAALARAPRATSGSHASAPTSRTAARRRFCRVKSATAATRSRGSAQQRTDSTFDISVTYKRQGEICTMIMQLLNEWVPLNGTFAPGSYTLRVNDTNVGFRRRADSAGSEVWDHRQRQGHARPRLHQGRAARRRYLQGEIAVRTATRFRGSVQQRTDSTFDISVTYKRQGEVCTMIMQLLGNGFH